MLRLLFLLPSPREAKEPLGLPFLLRRPSLLPICPLLLLYFPSSPFCFPFSSLSLPPLFPSSSLGRRLSNHLHHLHHLFHPPHQWHPPPTLLPPFPSPTFASSSPPGLRCPSPSGTGIPSPPPRKNWRRKRGGGEGESAAAARSPRTTGRTERWKRPFSPSSALRALTHYIAVLHTFTHSHAQEEEESGVASYQPRPSVPLLSASNSHTGASAKEEEGGGGEMGAERRRRRWK